MCNDKLLNFNTIILKHFKLAEARNNSLIKAAQGPMSRPKDVNQIWNHDSAWTDYKSITNNVQRQLEPENLTQLEYTIAKTKKINL